MSDNIDEVIENMKQPSVWMRLVIMAGFAFVLYLVFVPVVILLAIAQALFVIITGESNRNLRGLASVIEQYVSQIVAFITYNSDEKPFPFSDFPDEDLSVDDQSINETEAKAKPQPKSAAVNPADESQSAAPEAKKTVKKAAPKKVAKKTAAKKSTAKKKAVKKTAKVTVEPPIIEAAVDDPKSKNE